MAYLRSYTRTRYDWIVPATMQNGKRPPWHAMQSGSTSNTEASRSEESSSSTPSNHSTNPLTIQTPWTPQQTGLEFDRSKPTQRKSMSECTKKETPIKKDLEGNSPLFPQGPDSRKRGGNIKISRESSAITVRSTDTSLKNASRRENPTPHNLSL